MPVPPDASSRDRWLDLADVVRAQRQDAIAKGDRDVAEQWDEHERTLLRYAYEDVPYPDAGAPAAGDRPTSTVGDLIGAASRGAAPPRYEGLPIGPNGELLLPPSPPEREPTPAEKFLRDILDALGRTFPERMKPPGGCTQQGVCDTTPRG
jgi:hypothetical protein